MMIELRRERSASNVWFLLLIAFFIILWISGGASKSTVIGQAAVRGAAVAPLVAAFLFAKRPDHQRLPGKPVLMLLLATIALVIFQLTPVPAGLWSMLPGRSDLAAALPGTPISRPFTMVPGATANAAASLLVPLTTLILIILAGPKVRFRCATLLLALIAVSMLLGALKFSGIYIENPLINDSRLDVAGNFANRNHFALILALGCLIAPVWAFLPGRPERGRGAITLILIPLFMLIALASGSRAGLFLCCLGLGLGVFLARRPLRSIMRAKPSWMLPTLIAVGVSAIAALGLASVVFGRAVAVNRALDMNAVGDLRIRALPTVISMIKSYFPAGAGFGSFDTVFRIHEPFALLKPTYFNHAHNDFLEIVLDGGLPGLVLLIAGLGWWIWASVRVWRKQTSPNTLLARLGSAMLLLIFLASIVDYPARTPIVMAIMVMAALWLEADTATPGRPALPTGRRHI